MKAKRITVDLLVEHEDDPVVIELYEEISKFLKISKANRAVYQFNVALEEIQPINTSLFRGAPKKR